LFELKHFFHANLLLVFNNLSIAYDTHPPSRVKIGKEKEGENKTIGLRVV
jgi:hypothetical protein